MMQPRSDCWHMVDAETSDLNVALNFDLDLESGQIVVLIHADLASHAGMDCTCFLLLLYKHDEHPAEPG